MNTFKTTNPNTWYARWCIKAHGNQRYGNNPYQYHLEAVANLALRFGFDDEKVDMVCWAHDVLEDTNETRETMLAAGFPLDVVEAVEALKDEPGANRKERKAKTLPKIARIYLAKIGKLCDRLGNALVGEKLNMYKGEHPQFKELLYDPTETALLPLWQAVNSILD